MPCDCPSCKRDNILNGTLIEKCGFCQKQLDALTPFQIMADKSLVCEPCVKEHYTECVNCNKPFKKSEVKKVKLDDGNGNNVKVDKCVCPRCFASYYKECECCHEYFDRHDVMSHANKFYCKPCFTKSFQICTHCNKVDVAGSMTHTIRKTYLVCNDCWSYYGPVGTYETKPYKLDADGNPIAPFVGKPPHYFGIELECELANAVKIERGPKAEEVINLLGDFAVVKEDGSLRCGFEICSKPASLEEHYKHWNPFFDKLPTNLVSFNSAGGNCGLHIHCSKKPLTLLTIAKMVVFVNSEKNQPRIERIAGRGSNIYSCYSPKKYSTVNRIRDRQLSRSERYEAINLINRDTIEFRIFKGTLKRESFFKALEFCDSLIQFCMPGNNGIVYCREWDNYVSFVEKRAKDWPHLFAFISAKFLKRPYIITVGQGKPMDLCKQYGFSVQTDADASQV